MRRSADFERLLKAGRRAKGNFVVLIWKKETGGQSNKLGMIIPAKVGVAVTRNRLRRIFREIIRQMIVRLDFPLSILIQVKSPVGKTDFPQVKREILSFLEKIEKN